MDPRIRGHEISIRVVNAGSVVAEINSVASFNEEAKLELKEDAFLGENVNRFDEIFNGFGGDFEFQTNSAKWVELQQAIIARAQRVTPSVTFNVVRTDFYANGETAVFTYQDVKWGAMPTSVSSRGDYVKIKATFACGERPVAVNSLM